MLGGVAHGLARTQRAAALAAVTLAGLGGCGTILGRHEPRPVLVVTNPPGAWVSVDDEALAGPTPCQVFLDPAKKHRLVARKGTLVGATQVDRRVETWVVLADVFTGSLGLWIDWRSGALYRLPEHVVLNLGPPQLSSDAAPAASAPRAGGPRCVFCDEPRGDGPGCQHCGMERAYVAPDPLGPP